MSFTCPTYRGGGGSGQHICSSTHPLSHFHLSHPSLRIYPLCPHHTEQVQHTRTVTHTFFFLLFFSCGGGGQVFSIPILLPCVWSILKVIHVGIGWVWFARLFSMMIQQFVHKAGSYALSAVHLINLRDWYLTNFISGNITILVSSIYFRGPEDKSKME